MTHLIKSSASHIALIKRILEEPEAVALVQALDPQVLKKLIEHIGLEEAGEIIELATAPQIATIFDEELWRNKKPGQAEVFDVARLKLWLEVMVLTNVEEAAGKWVAMDEKFALMVLDRFILVLNHSDLKTLMEGSENAHLLEKAFSNHRTLQFNSFLLISKDDQVWDAITALVVEADKKNNDWLVRQLNQCQRMSTAYIEDNDGLYQVLTDSERLLSDVAEEREERRESLGHVAPQTASHFLFLITQASLEELVNATPPDPITRAYFTSFSPRDSSPLPAPSKQLQPEPEPPLRLMHILTEAKILVEVAADSPSASPAGSSKLLREALTQLAEKDPKLHQQRILELGYLANTLMVGHAHKKRRYLPAEAAQAVVDICNQGLAHIAESMHSLDTDDARLKLIREQDMVKMFRVGWKLAKE